MSTLVTSHMLNLYWQFAEECGISRSDLLQTAGIPAETCDDPNGMVSDEAAREILRALIKLADDPALGLRIARMLDLRKLGFLGYALMSSLTLRQRIQLHLRFYKLHAPRGQAFFRVEGGRAVLDFSWPELPPDLAPVLIDSSLTITAMQLAKHFQCARPDVELWLPIPELPHHRELRALVSGPVVFEAPHIRVSFPEKELDRRLLGDPHLYELARQQLETQLAKVTQVFQGDLLLQVRERLDTRLSADASLESVAADLRISARTLRRRLNELGASFQELLEDVRRVRAISYLVETNQAIERVASFLGYRDPANFRRAFRRWTGAAPADYRRQHRRARVSAE